MVVPDRLFPVDAILEGLQQRLAREVRSSLTQPALALGPEGPGERGDEEPRRLAHQMVVGRGVAREMPGDEVAVAVDACEPAAPEAPPLLSLEYGGGLRAQQVPGEGPVDEPDGVLEAGAPVDAPRIGTVIQPGIDEDLGAIGIALIRCQ